MNGFKMKINLLTIGPDNTTGFRKHLEELSKLINKGNFLAVKEKYAAKTLPKIMKIKSTLTIIGGRNWIKRNHKILEKIPGKKGILYTSPLAQAEISNEEIANLKTYFSWLDSKKIDYLFFSSKSLAERFDRDDVYHLPAPSITDLNLFKQKKKVPKTNTVGLINNKARHKNILNTIAGVSLSSKTKEFIINGLNEEYEDLLKRFGLKKRTKNVGFLSNKRYNEIMLSLKLSVHISFSESYCYSVFKAMAVGTPVLVSKAIDWVKIKDLIINDLRDHEEIAKKIDYVLGLSKADYIKLSSKCQKNAMQSIENNNKTSKKVIEKILRLHDQ